MRSLTSEDLHKTLLDIAKEFDGICRKHNIPYYMLGGTMLGAVRHKGFIPWDDDMDFGVMRPDFNRLKEALKADLPEQYELLTLENCDGVKTEAFKISDKRTLIDELHKEDSKDEMGVFVDVFALDYTNGNTGLFSKNWLIHLLVKLQVFRFSTTIGKSFPKKVLAYAVKILFFAMKRTAVIRRIEKLVDKQGTHIANHYGMWGIREIVSATVMEPPQLYRFEDIELYGSRDADAYLSNLYGNYMELPPLNKRHLHIENMWFR